MTLFAASATELVRCPPALDHRLHNAAVTVYQQPLLRIASPDSHHFGAPTTCSTDQLSETNCVPCPERLTTLPVEIVDRILADLIHPHCRLPGLTETQSQYGFTEKQKRSVKDKEDLTQPADTDR
ncbi:hypothetical protein COCC4DRAFT_128655 [Bipolaris maydis ATCC 48331]|uniref:Uncharacterized protein n=2 Tax=Cochliobolus heterostrophus TaxID=5016 RepID=M2TZU2_COCH5|nr:uncharacterized protein COCC4DRAFT_128655 [Bipolaris maydis ATCC 48331]EMD91794.1 hypothetical protein COCHEDRAFT_1214196 [Bipolaris maydis C5]KAH7559582.1 hypothetical protein BM1_04519 [Bipolaris maydis]ENI08448.1 hypothetical protein COCC4DRAFT_128655 [Bipolaris maydis ATCC 48331]KAJ5027068.1 hypothetical protein J3E73DRAFT_368851 [Bipolaris maydis]KAJ6209154.1 hypothetical protein PSV09DRAFT_1214196 [Bipolaris maydis]